MILYIHQHICISPQPTHQSVETETIIPSKDGKLIALEPSLEGIPPAMQRRLSKALRMGLGAGLPIITHHQVDGILLGTANGGMEDCIKFLNQIIDYEEGLLTPANFVQSTPNSIAGQLSLITKNRGYNATHVHLGLAFENALLDAQMLLSEQPGTQYLVGAVDEISTYNYNIDLLAGWYKKDIDSSHLYENEERATIAGEGAAMFLINDREQQAIAEINAVETLHTTDENLVKEKFADFLARAKPQEQNILLIFGENGDTRLQPFYNVCQSQTGAIPIARFKHATGEYPTAASFAVWLACRLIQTQTIPEHYMKTGSLALPIETVLIYNHYQGRQHSFISVARKK